MASPDNLVVIYKELADSHERQAQPQMRDRFLVLAADAALSAGRPAEADLLLARLLRSNPHHMLRPFTSFKEAMASPDIQNYVGELRRTYPPEQAEAQFDALRAARGAPAPARPTRALPPTAPVVDIDQAPAADDAEREPLKVYRVQDEIDRPPVPAPPRAPRAAPRPPPKPPRPARPMPPAPPAAAAGLVHPAPAADGEDGLRGSWFSAVLFVLLFAAALALAGWTILQPFLPHG